MCDGSQPRLRSCPAGKAVRLAWGSSPYTTQQLTQLCLPCFCSALVARCVRSHRLKTSLCHQGSCGRPWKPPVFQKQLLCTGLHGRLLSLGSVHIIHTIAPGKGTRTPPCPSRGSRILVLGFSVTGRIQRAINPDLPLINCPHLEQLFSHFCHMRCKMRVHWWWYRSPTTEAGRGEVKAKALIHQNILIPQSSSESITAPHK